MRNFIMMSSLAVLLSSSPLALAANVDAATITQIHAVVESQFAAKCEKDMAGSTTAICQCLAKKAQANLDDAALGQCANDSSGGPCVQKIVTAAAQKALSKDSIQACGGTAAAK